MLNDDDDDDEDDDDDDDDDADFDGASKFHAEATCSMRVQRGKETKKTGERTQTIWTPWNLQSCSLCSFTHSCFTKRIQ